MISGNKLIREAGDYVHDLRLDGNQASACLFFLLGALTQAEMTDADIADCIKMAADYGKEKTP